MSNRSSGCRDLGADLSPVFPEEEADASGLNAETCSLAAELRPLTARRPAAEVPELRPHTARTPAAEVADTIAEALAAEAGVPGVTTSETRPTLQEHFRAAQARAQKMVEGVSQWVATQWPSQAKESFEEVPLASPRDVELNTFVMSDVDYAQGPLPDNIRGGLAVGCGIFVTVALGAAAFAALLRARPSPTPGAVRHSTLDNRTNESTSESTNESTNQGRPLPAKPIGPGIFKMQDLCLSYAASADGEHPALRKCPAKEIPDSQSWSLDGKHHMIRNRQGLCLELRDGGVGLAECDERRRRQRWQVDSSQGRIRNEAALQCLSALDDAQGSRATTVASFTKVGLRRCDEGSTAARSWHVPRKGRGELRSVRGHGCLTSDRLKGDNAVGAVGVHGQVCERDATSWWFLPDMGHIRVGSLAEGDRCLEAPVANNNRREVLARPCQRDSSQQRWHVYTSGHLVSHLGSCLAPARQGVDGGRLIVEPCSAESGHQRWSVPQGIVGRPGRPWKSTSSKTSRTRRPAAQSAAPLLDFYVYRATSSSESAYRFGDLNAANIDGVIWYLMNEVVTEYTAGTRCPRKFDISTIRRFRIKARASEELFKQGMNFGVRFAYDRGQCTGRCFAKNMCTCQSDCEKQFDTYGYVLGCNNFRDDYPFPGSGTPAPKGIWYSMPFDGRCSSPTGAHNCTWSYDPAGEVTLKELQATAPGGGNCCEGQCTNFWENQFDVGQTNYRIKQVLELFERKYPDQPWDLKVPCDFKRWRWYAEDRFKRVDPWAAGCTKRQPY